ncbi:MAG: alpha/beta hydrolase [Afipia sp.]|nr:alpha/beta hydrolase [Afipia sp.]
MPDHFRDFFCQAPDGLKLHAKILGEAKTSTLPVLCLPGLTRTADDFDVIARALSGAPGAPRQVIAMDFRGRGLSAYDAKPENYNVVTECGDVIALLGALGISRAIFLGTSRGGLVSMVMAATKPDLMAALILNDIGPALEIKGLMKIIGYIANPPPRKTFDEAARGLKELFSPVFPKLDDAGWMAWAHRAFREKKDGSGLERTYDLKLNKTLEGIDPANPPQPIWDLFDKLAGKPLMLIHADLSDLVSPQGVKDMVARRPDIDLVEVPNEGHAPLLADKPTIDRILAFCARCDRA